MFRVGVREGNDILVSSSATRGTKYLIINEKCVSLMYAFRIIMASHFYLSILDIAEVTYTLNLD